ncbi:DNA methyltransferase [Virgibacillus sp. CBA3643]|uniref:DNA methyltransferase n=1 Tax=Virgibacillus sp. CBA3643 TaxID=2942278 RepID=UPI0035A39E5B
MALTQQQKFIDLLKEIFQFDQADLDFGIYRIMNQKRDEINSFLNNELVPQVRSAFEKYKDADIEEVKQQINDLEQQLNDMGVAKESSEKYLTLNEKLHQSVDISALENEVFSDLTNFFRRYYHEGDFLSLRRYKKDVYAIPYEGEEVKLHWANADQYYVKTSEYFRDYSFKLPSGKTVHFKLVEASTEQNNNKEQDDKERRFILYEQEPINEIDGELYIYFEYKAPERKQTQQRFNVETLEHIFSNVENIEWLEELQTLSPTEKNKKRTLLEKYLIDYTARNTFDYFIHKDLGGFLRRELDFFIKNEIMHLDDLDTENEQRFEQYLSKIKVIKNIGHKIIAFVEQIENFQKRLWLKKKFVVESEYCITLDKIPLEFYEEIAQNQEQIDEWINLFSINDLNEFTYPLSHEFLSQNKYLLIDTKFFNETFKERLLSHFEDIDNQVDGELIHSENFQALNTLKNKYEEEIDVIYADPPYNAASSEILYKNAFKHSSWISFMLDRMSMAGTFKKTDGALITAIDENEFVNLLQLLNDKFPQWTKTCLSIIHNPAGVQGDNFSYNHEYAIFSFENKKNIIGKTERTEKSEEAFRDWGGTSSRSLAKNCFYPIYVKDKEIIGFGDVCPDDFHPGSSNIVKDDVIEVYPVAENGEERKWVFARNSVEAIIDDLYVKESNGLLSITRIKSKTSYKTVWTDKRYYANIYGSKLLNNIMGSKKFDFPKSLYTVQDCLNAVNLFRKKKSITLDYFAGSGTTGHAVIDMNRDDEGDRKYILIEMGEYFNTVTKPRIQKVIYSKDWKDGKPVSRNGISQMFKYMKLESYEDTLNNIELQRTSQQQEAMESAMSSDAREEYLLSYMLDVESEGSSSLLNIDSFNNPFNYKMLIQDGMETRRTKIDLVETFNYLIGLYVNTIDTFQGIKVITGTLRTGEESLIIWRNMDEVSNEKLENFFKKQEYNTKDTEFDRIYVNGDNHLENMKTDVDQWKVILIEEEFKRLMFDVHDV